MNQVYRIAVIGSGTRGLAATTILSRDGRDVSVFERFDEPRPLGAGILLQPTSLACPACLGLDDETISPGSPVLILYGEDVNGSTIFDIFSVLEYTAGHCSHAVRQGYDHDALAL